MPAGQVRPWRDAVRPERGSSDRPPSAGVESILNSHRAERRLVRVGGHQRCQRRESAPPPTPTPPPTDHRREQSTPAAAGDRNTSVVMTSREYCGPFVLPRSVGMRGSSGCYSCRCASWGSYWCCRGSSGCCLCHCGSYITMYIYTPFSGQCMHFGNSAGNCGGSAVRRSVGHDSAAAMSKLVALLPNYIQIVQNWSEKGVCVIYVCHIYVSYICMYRVFHNYRYKSFCIIFAH